MIGSGESGQTQNGTDDTHESILLWLIDFASQRQALPDGESTTLLQFRGAIPALCQLARVITSVFAHNKDVVDAVVARLGEDYDLSRTVAEFAVDPAQTRKAASP